MAKIGSQDNLVFGLDIGTRSIVGTVGYLKGETFHIVAQYVKEHETRAMLDGQIHDIMKVGETIKKVKEELERRLNVELVDVCIAAAGRALRTVTAKAETDFGAEKEITNEDIYNLLMDGVEKAYAVFGEVNDTDLKFYCVGYTPMHFYMNDYQIGNLEGHKATRIAVDMIATFLPDDVVDALYKAVDIAGLKVSNLTLEPIAAIQVAIPDKFRMLNLALVDVGAGTSDISITNDGTIVAYGMIPTAGDSLTNIIVQNCLVEFDTAEMIKRSASTAEVIEYTDIIGLPQTIESSAVLAMLDDKLDEITGLVADEIIKLNGEKSVSAVFVVGGGGTVPGFTEKLSQKLGIVKERVAIRGKEVMQGIVFENEDAIKDSLMVTPIGICLSFYEQSNNFIFVEFNGTRLKLYDTGHLTVSDIALQVSFANEDLFPKRGEALNFTLNGNQKMIRGEQGDSSIITINGNTGDLYTKVSSGDIIKVIPSTMGASAVATLGSLKEMSEPLHTIVNGKNVSLPKTAMVNGELQNSFYEIAQDDVIEVNNFYTVKELCELLELEFDNSEILVNGTPATENTRVYENFTLDFTIKNEKVNTVSEDIAEASTDEETEDNADDTEVDSFDGNAEDAEVDSLDGNAEDAEAKEAASDSDTAEEPAPKVVHSINIIANGKTITMNGKKEYIFVDVFDYIDFDLRNPAGRSIITTINGEDAEYMKELNEGDVLEIYWKQDK